MLKRLFKGMKIKAVTKIQPPFTMPCALEQGGCADGEGGINYDVFFNLMKVLGIEFEMIEAERRTTGYKDEDGIWRGMLGQLQRGEANMTATLIGYNSERIQVADYCTPVAYFQNGFVIHRPTARDLRALPTFLSSPLRAETWGLALCTIFVTLLVFIAARSLLDKVLCCYAIREQTFLSARHILQQPTYTSEKITVRTMMMFVSIGLFFLTAQYSSGLTSQLLVEPKAYIPFTGLDQYAQMIYDGKIGVISDKDPNLPGFVPITDMKDSDEVGEKIRIAYQWNPPVFVPKNDEKALVDAIVKNASLVYFGSYYRLLNIISQSCDVIAIEDTYRSPTWLAFAFPKGSPLQNMMTTALHHDATSSSSFVQRLYKKYAKERSCSETVVRSNYEPMSIKNMQGAFWIVLFGCVTALLSLFGELLYKKFSFLHRFLAKKHITEHKNNHSKIIKMKPQRRQIMIK